ncbi:MAG: PH domain-containing protein [Actinobacteria bacterium]|nr:PH domain-containing protein [Actinomycetota bacterium]
MAFPLRLLNEEEDIVLDLHPHWWFFTGPASLLALAAAGLVALMASDLPEALTMVVAALTVAMLVWLVGRYLRWVTTNFVVTTDRLIYRSGVLGKSGTEIPLDRVNTMFFHQTIFERLLRSGDLIIESGGETGRQTFSDIAKPSSVQNTIYQQIEANEMRTAGGGQVGATSISQELRNLDELRRSGVLSEAEFEAQKAKLLGR